ncbi:MAG: transketolase C-terminal domain-containing protein [Acidobacteriota bacterium]
MPDGEHLVPFGEARLVREGSDVTIVAISRMVLRAIEAAEHLADEGISLEIIDPRTVVPLDLNAIVKSVEKTGRLIIAHEGYTRCGIAAEIATRVMEEALYCLEKPIRRVCGHDVPVPFAPVLENYVMPGASDLERAVKELR